MKRLVSPALNPAGLMAAAGAVYAAAVMISNAVHHHGLIDPAVIIAAAGAVAALLTRQAVTPVADPRDGNGEALLRVGTVAQAVRGGGPPAVLRSSSSLTAEQMEAIREVLAQASGRMAPAQGPDLTPQPVDTGRTVPPTG